MLETSDSAAIRRDGDLFVQEVDGLSVRLREPFSLGFLRKFGTVFHVFDDQDSGNLCFGMEKDGARYFVKFAGAPTARKHFLRAGCGASAQCRSRLP